MLLKGTVDELRSFQRCLLERVGSLGLDFGGIFVHATRAVAAWYKALASTLVGKEHLAVGQGFRCRSYVPPSV